MDTTDFKILKAISDQKVAYPRAAKINSIVNLDLEEFGARLGVLEMEGYIKTQSEVQLYRCRLPPQRNMRRRADQFREARTVRSKMVN